MDYFHIMSDNRVTVPKLNFTEKEINTDAIMKQVSLPDSVEQVDLLVVRSNRDIFYLVSTMVQEILEMSQEEVSTIPVQLVDLEHSRMDAYWLLNLPEEEGWIQNYFEKQEDMVVRIPKDEDRAVILLKNQNHTYLIANLAFTEMLLRRHVFGLRIEKVKVVES